MAIRDYPVPTPYPTYYDADLKKNLPDVGKVSAEWERLATRDLGRPPNTVERVELANRAKRAAGLQSNAVVTAGLSTWMAETLAFSGAFAANVIQRSSISTAQDKLAAKISDATGTATGTVIKYEPKDSLGGSAAAVVNTAADTATKIAKDMIPRLDWKIWAAAAVVAFVMFGGVGATARATVKRVARTAR